MKRNRVLPPFSTDVAANYRRKNSGRSSAHDPTASSGGGKGNKPMHTKVIMGPQKTPLWFQCIQPAQNEIREL
jgi:hypothetical protein